MIGYSQPCGVNLSLGLLYVSNIESVMNISSNQNSEFPAFGHDVEYSEPMVLGQPLIGKQIVSLRTDIYFQDVMSPQTYPDNPSFISVLAMVR